MWPPKPCQMPRPIKASEAASLLQIMKRYWATHLITGDEIDALTVVRVRSILAEHRRKHREPMTRPRRLEQIAKALFEGVGD
jgi:hypothetical protein